MFTLAQRNCSKPEKCRPHLHLSNHLEVVFLHRDFESEATSKGPFLCLYEKAIWIAPNENCDPLFVRNHML